SGSRELVDATHTGLSVVETIRTSVHTVERVARMSASDVTGDSGNRAWRSPGTNVRSMVSITMAARIWRARFGLIRPRPAARRRSIGRVTSLGGAARSHD